MMYNPCDDCKRLCSDCAHYSQMKQKRKAISGLNEALDKCRCRAHRAEETNADLRGQLLKLTEKKEY